MIEPLEAVISVVIFTDTSLCLVHSLTGLGSYNYHNNSDDTCILQHLGGHILEKYMS